MNALWIDRDRSKHSDKNVGNRAPHVQRPGGEGKRQSKPCGRPRSAHTWWHRVITWLLAPVMIIATMPTAVLAEQARGPVPPVIPPQVSQKPAHVRTGPHKLKPVKVKLEFSANASDLEISTARVFGEPLIPMSCAAIAGENQALVKAILSFKKKGNLEDVSDFTHFMAAFPGSRWLPSLEMNVGILRYHAGYLSEALHLWEAAWQAAKDEQGVDQKAVAERALGELLCVNMHLGRMKEMEALLAQVEHRRFTGSSEELVRTAREGLKLMDVRPERSFRCGPLALNSIVSLRKGKMVVDPTIAKCASTKDGTTLAQVKQLSDQVGLKMQLAKRAPGAPVIVPSVIHWTVNHFGAITERDGQEYKIEDPTFLTDGVVTVSAQALDQETDGYSLVPEGPLPKGWRSVTLAEAQAVSGKGAPSTFDDNSDMKCGAPQSSGGNCTNPPSCPMAQANAWLTNACLHIVDTPLEYTPPIGPAIKFRINFNYLEANQPASYVFSNLGNDWTVNWLSYLTVSGTTATVRVRGGGSEVFTQSGGVYTNDMTSQALLVNVGTNSYERQLPDGTVESYNLADSSSPPNIFLTQVTDPQGNSVLIQYDGNFRITSITDAINQVSTISYVSNTLGNAGFYKISQISDPFGRTCSFSYDSATTTQLLTITDVLGLTSNFDYDSSTSFITAMTTPYGTTSFYQYATDPALSGRGLRANLPDGSSYVLESWLYPDPLPATYFWDREATALYPDDPANQNHTHCKTTTWLTTPGAGPMEPIPNTEQSALENKISYLYTGESFDQYGGIAGTGTINKPIQISRQMNSPINATIGGTVTSGNVLSLTFTDTALAGGTETVNYTAQSGDTLSSIASNLASAINSDASLTRLGVQAAALSTVVTISSLSPNDTLYSESTSGGATETVTLANSTMQSFELTIGGTPRSGDTLSFTFVDATNFSGNTSYYTVTGSDTLATIASNEASALNSYAPFTARGMIATAFSGNIFITTSYPVAITWDVDIPTGGATETLTVDYQVSNGTQLYQYQYNSFGHMIMAIDPVGRVFTYTYGANNIDLTQITEVRGGDNYVLGNWTYNSQHEPTQYIDGSGQEWQYSYNSSGQLTSTTDPASKVTSLTYTGTNTATIGGTKTTGDALTITTHDAGLSGGQEAVNYTVLSTDTLSTIAAALAAAINADTSLQAIGVSATSTGSVLNLSSTSTNVTTYSESESGGATETISLGVGTFGFLTQINGPLSGNDDITTFAYDGYNRLASTTDSEGYTLNYSYDNANRLTQTSYPDSTTEQMIYDKLDAVFKKDRIGRWTEDAFDSLRQLSFEIDPLGRKTQYAWCVCGSLKTLTDPAGNVTTWNHDLEGRTIEKVYPDQSAISYVYEPTTGRLLSKTDALNQTCSYFYNVDNTQNEMAYSNAVNATSNVAYAFDPIFRRVTSVQNGWGTISYTYNAYITNPLGTPITGGGRLASVSNNVISNSDITYTYDSLGRTTNRSINGGSNSTTWGYDAMSRITSEANPLGTFDYAYVDDVSGSSKGTLRLASISYPNSQTTNFSWYGNTGDQRLQEISNLNPSGATLSQFNYSYDPAGEITQWQQQQNSNNLFYNLAYDQAGQLISSQVGSGAPQPPYSQELYYAYDQASNRTSVQSTAVQTVRVAGTVTSGDNLSITVNDPALSGGSETVLYTVQSGDTLSSIAAALAQAVNTDTNLQTLGVNANAQSSKTFINIRSVSNNITTYSASSSGTETLSLGIFKNGIENATVGGSKTTGDVLTITVVDPALSGGQQAVSYTVLSGDNLSSITTGLKNAINGNSNLSTHGVSATVAQDVVSIASTSTNVTSYTESVSAGATETIALAVNENVNAVALIGGSKTTGDTVTITVFDAGLSGGDEAVTYTVLLGDTLTSIASAVVSAINADTNLQNIGIVASSSGTVVTIQSNSTNPTTYRQSTSTGATETIGLTTPTYAWQTAVIGGSKTTGDVVSITAYDTSLSGGKETASYTVLSGDTLNSITSGLASAISGDSNLSNIGVTATSSGPVVSIESDSPNLTTYTQSVSSGATETITLGSSTGIQQAQYNNLNELVALAPGGAANFQGSTNKAVQSASVAGQVISIKQSALPAVSLSQSVAGVATETASITQQEGLATITFGGTITAGDVVSLTIADQQLPNGPETQTYTVKSTDTTSSIASALATLWSHDSWLGGGFLNIYAGPSSNTISMFPLNQEYYEPCIYSVTATGVPTETVTYSANSNGNTTATISGSVTIGDVLTLTVNNSNLSGGQESVNYTATSGDTDTSIATALKNAINADSNLTAIGMSATSSGAVVSIATAGTTYTESVSGGATETISLGSNANGNIAVAIGGSKTTGDVLTLTTHNPLLSGGSEAVSYTVLSGDNLVSIAAGLAAAVNADSNLQTLGVSASNTNAASLAFSRSFSGNGILPAGSSTALVSGVDGASNTKTNGYALSVPNPSGASLSFDANGNMTSDGTNNYSYDAENRLVKVTYPGSGNYSVFAYDGLGRNVLIQEYTSSSLTSTKQFVWAKDNFSPYQPCEARDASSVITAQYFPLGETISGTDYFYTTDHLGLINAMVQASRFAQLSVLNDHPAGFNPVASAGSTREMTNSSGTVESQLAYDPYGRVAQIQGGMVPDFQYAGYYEHARSSLSITRTRAYSARSGRFITRDLIGENGGLNLYGYVNNEPTEFTDPLGFSYCCQSDGSLPGPDGSRPSHPGESGVPGTYTPNPFASGFGPPLSNTGYRIAPGTSGFIYPYSVPDNGGSPIIPRNPIDSGGKKNPFWNECHPSPDLPWWTQHGTTA